MKLTLIVLVVVGCAGWCMATTSKADALITSLPGLDKLPSFDMYSGYITLPGTTQNIFYWFVESANDPTNDPVVLWLQGGPGCSGLGDGLLWENGPFYTTIVNATTQEIGLREAYYSWNKFANVIYFESPCGVGFSYGTSPGDDRHSDNSTAIDNALFLQEWFNVFPEFQNNVLWLSGESYGGIYTPTLAYQILTNYSASFMATNLKRGGITMGNPVTGCGNDTTANAVQVNLFFWHGMVSPRTYTEWLQNGCAESFSTTCENLLAKIYRGVGQLDQPLASAISRFTENTMPESRSPRLSEPPKGAINPDCLYYDFCTGNATLFFDNQEVVDCLNIPERSNLYLNNAAVQKAIHAQPTHWKECGGVIYDRNVDSILPYLEQMFSIAPSMRIMYYSGDIDIATVPFANTMFCLNTMQRPVVQEWQPWVVNREIAGYVEIYDTYQYTTLKGFQPEAAFLMYKSFINNIPLPVVN